MKNKLHSPPMMNKKELAPLLINWYHKNARKLPWRTVGGAHFDPYQVWISEIMLQQTTVKTVEGYFQKWMEKFPTLEDLAQTDIEEVLLCWQGLGYYTRARKIHECAQVLTSKYQGKFPRERNELLKLPGIGPYSASSILAFAFNQKETVVDGNVIRVISRLFGIETPLNKEKIFQLAETLTDEENPADYASGIMDLGATICTPQSAKCLLCPWQKFCIAREKNIQDKIPFIQKPEKKKFEGFVHLIKTDKNEYFIQKRIEKGLLNGLYEFPWTKEKKVLFKANWKEKNCSISHVFTHFHLTLHLIETTLNTPPNQNGFFVPLSKFKDYPFSTLMKKVIKKIEN